MSRTGARVAAAFLVLFATLASAAGDAAWSALLKEHVRDGWVDYRALNASGGRRLSAYLAQVAQVRREEYAAWSRTERLSYWLNAYNAFVIKQVLDHYPLESIRDIGPKPLAVFREPFIPLGNLPLSGASTPLSPSGVEDASSSRATAMLSLDQVEEGIRKEREPRAHFALVCAARSCPRLRSEAYRADALDRQLADAAHDFIVDRTRNHFEAATRILFLSPIFNWYRADFEQAAGSLESFVARYEDEATATSIAAGPVRIRFLEYDWSLNGR